MTKTNFKALAQNIDSEILELSLLLAEKEAQRDGLQRKLRSEYLSDEEVTAKLSRVFDSWHQIKPQLKALGDVYRHYNWNRAYIVSGGHVHSTPTGCPGFKFGTQVYLVPECSALTEAEIVELAGDRACTHCYPSAPLSALQQASKLFAPDEAEKAARAAEREAKRSAKKVAELTVTLPQGEYGGGKAKDHTFSTVRGARNEASRLWMSMLYYPGSSSGHIENFEAIVAAVAVREGLDSEALRKEIIGKVEKRFIAEVKKSGVGYTGCTAEQAREMLAGANAMIIETR